MEIQLFAQWKIRERPGNSTWLREGTLEVTVCMLNVNVKGLQSYNDQNVW